MTGVLRKKSSLGVLGGSFDPIHNGHLYLAEQVRNKVGIEKITLLPACMPPHKLKRNQTDPAHRLEMIRLVVESLDWIEIDDCEIRRGGISFTVDTVRAIKKAKPQEELYFIIGTDSLRELHTWRSIREIAETVTFITVPRDEEPVSFPSPALEAQLNSTPLRVVPLDVPPLPVSSTEIRTRLSQGLPVDDLLPSAVLNYIETHRLYRSG